MIANSMPKLDDSIEKWKTYFDRTVFRRESPHRIWLMSIWERARLYLASQQWLERDYTEDPTRTPFWRPLQMTEANWIPTVVQNEFVAPIQNEAARLFGAGSRPSVRADNNSPKAARAAKVGSDVLLDRMENLQWTEKEYEGDFWLPLYGTWPVLSWWEIDYTKTVSVGKDSALRCTSQDCDFRLADAEVPQEKVAEFAHMKDRMDVKVTPDPNNPLVPPRMSGRAKACLQCEPKPPEMQMLGEDGQVVADAGLRMPGAPQPVPLESYTPEDEEAAGGKDFFDRRLGEDIPLGDTALENVSPYDLFPQSDGLEKTFETLDSCGIEQIKSLDWFAAHFENGHLVKAESAEEMTRWHPIVGGSSEYFGGAWGADPDLFSNHARLRTWFRKPWIEGETREKNHGVLVYMANNVMLSIGPLEVESQNRPGKYISRLHLDGVPWELRDKELFGLSGSELIFSEQDLINTERSQAVHARHLFGSPKIMAEEGMDLHFAGFTETRYDSDIWYYRPLTPGDKPFVFSGQEMGSGWERELQNDVGAINRTMGVTDVETGNAPKDVSAASALQYLGEKASERRKPRVARIRSMKRRVYKHQLEMIHEFYREERFYSVKGKNDRTSIRCFRGDDLMGQTNVMVEDEDSFDVRLVQRESLESGKNLGSFTVDTAVSKRRVNTILGLPLDINADQNRQVEQAQEEWIRYIEDGVEPAVDMRGDYHTIHFQCHQLDLETDEATLLKDEVDWNQVQLALYGWEEQLTALEGAEAMLKMPDPAPKPDPNGNISPDEVQHAVAEQQKRAQMRQMLEGMPRAPELRIAWLWDKILQGANIGWGGPEGTPGADRRRTGMTLIRFGAHSEAHYRLSQATAMAGAAGVPMPAAPGGPSNAAGMMPGGPGGPAAPAPGGGPTGSTASGDGMAA